MAAPTITQTYPADNDTGIPIGITLKVWFDGLVDLKSVMDAIHLFGAEFDRTSGPDTAIWIDKDTGDNPFFLTSPTFSGNAPLKYSLLYYDLSSELIVDPGVIGSTTDAVSANVAHVAYLTVDPKHMPSLSAETEYTLYMVGDAINDSGITGRTIFDVEPDPGNTGDGGVVNYGIWGGTGVDSIIIEITDAGDIGDAKYKWRYASELTSEARLGKVTTRRFRTLEDGVQVRFTGSNYQVGDIFTFNLESVEYMTDNMSISFITNDGSFILPPDSPSTPASSTPASSVLPWLGTSFQVEKMIPADGSYNVDKNNREIVIYFTEDIDVATVSADSVQLWNYPVSGHYQDTYEPYQLQREITIAGNIMTINF